jgi:DNA-directed RNA polymerase specialized sigma24 family protein
MNTRHSAPNATRAPIRRNRAIEAAIAHLQAPLRWVMILGERGGLSTGEIANLAGVGLEVVKSIQSRALALIERELQVRSPGCRA